MNSLRLSLEGITKKFPGVLALKNVDFDLREGEIHGLVGKNGAGKSTLISVLSGRLRPDSGKMVLMGHAIEGDIDPKKARELGIVVVSQDPEFVGEFSIAENLFLGKLPRMVNWRDLNREASKIVARIGIDVDPKQRMDDLSVGQQQLTCAGRSFFIGDSKVIVLDEVTASLTAKEQECLFELIRAHKRMGRSVIFISHLLDEIFKICDRVTVLRDGEKIGTYDVSSLDLSHLIDLVVGHQLAISQAHKTYHVSGRAQKEVLFSVKGLSNPFLKNIEFAIHKNEILGLVGLRGSGRTNLLKTLAGHIPLSSGSIRLNGNPIKISSPEDALHHGICMLYEDREVESLIPVLSVKENLTLSCLKRLLRKVMHLINHEKELTLVGGLIDKLKIITPSYETEVQYLSGGNKQKVVVGRLLASEPHIYLLDDPFRGIDVSSKYEILTLLITELSKGTGILLASSEIELLLSVCDKLLVLFKGRLIREFRREEFSVDTTELFKAMDGGYED